MQARGAPGGRHSRADEALGHRTRLWFGETAERTTRGQMGRPAKNPSQAPILEVLGGRATATGDTRQPAISRGRSIAIARS
jgi:hypothetical protein